MKKGRERERDGERKRGCTSVNKRGTKGRGSSAFSSLISHARTQPPRERQIADYEPKEFHGYPH